MQASLISYTHENQSLSNTGRSQYWNAKLPNVRYRREGMSIHHSLLQQAPFKSNEKAFLKLKLLLSLTPMLIISIAGVSSISHIV